MAATPSVYHEKQSLRCCALHAVNNILQAREFTKRDFDEICVQLTPYSLWFNPHRDFWGTGNYDVNVIMRAFALKNCEVQWFDRRKETSLVPVDQVIGILANKRSGGFFGMFASRHWFAIPKVDSVFYNCDSSIGVPRPFDTHQDLFTFLRTDVIRAEGEILLILRHEGGPSASSLTLPALSASEESSPSIELGQGPKADSDDD